LILRLIKHDEINLKYFRQEYEKIKNITCEFSGSTLEAEFENYEVMQEIL